jgi:pimeloyl-ACP methyl ester carboxylesterase
MDTILSTDGTAIAFERGGAGPTLVLVHGTAASHTRWATIRPRLERDFTVVAIDRRGRGESGDAEDYSIAHEAEDVVAVVRAFPGPVLLFGHSHGAICALEAATRLDGLAGLILYEPPIIEGRAVPAEAMARLEAMLAAGEREGVLAAFMTEIVGVPPRELEILRASPAWPARIAAAHTLPREARAVDDYELDAARLSSLSVPVLLLLGGDSPPFFADGTARLEATLPDVRKVVMPGQQHIAMDTAPEMVTEAVCGFWREMGGS